MGRRPARGGGRLARPGAHRARHGPHRRAPGAALPRHLPRHPGPRPEPVEPGCRPDEYCLAFYERLAVSLLDQLGVRSCLWLGTSAWAAPSACMRRPARCAGASSAGAQRHRPRAGASAVERIRTYAGSPPAFATMHELEQYFRTVYKPYGWLQRRQWRQLTETSMRRLPDGRVTPHYDPAMVQQFIHHPHDYLQWDAWDALDIPVLCLRGETQRPAAARGGRGHAHARPARGGGHHSRLRPRAGAEHARAVRLVERFLPPAPRPPGPGRSSPPTARRQQR
jgi:hypothetical protein